MDFMNLHQAAHGDREAGFLHTRMRLGRKVVVGHGSDPEVRQRWPPGPAPPTPGTTCRARSSPASATTCARSPSPRATRWRRRCASASPSTATASATSWPACAAVPDAAVDALSTRTGAVRGGAALRRAASATACCATAPARSSACGVPGGRRLQGLHHHLRGPARPRAAPRPRRAAAHGRRLRLRGRGRLEDRRAAARHEGHGRRPARRHVVHGGLHLPPRARRPARARRAHARGLPHDRRGPAALEVHPLGIGGKGDPVRLVFDAKTGPAINVSLVDLGHASA
jgi:L-arabinose isomerase